MSMPTETAGSCWVSCALRATLALTLFCAFSARRSAGQDVPPAPMQIEMALDSAVWAKGDQRPADAPPLLLFLVREGDHWSRVLGVADFCPSLHVGRVTQASVSDQALKATLSMNVYGDSYVPGGRGEYQVTLQSKDGRAFEGTYTGTYRGIAVQGRATARILPPAPRFNHYPQAIAPGEHPRLLFRKSDLPALREKAKSPIGEALLAKAGDDIGLAIRYQLTGDRQFADQARESVERLLNGNHKDARTPGSHHGIFHLGWTWEHPAVCYDLCYDAWDEPFRKRVERYITLWAERILWQRGMFNTQGQYTYGNGEAGTLYYGTGLGALALYGQKGPEPAKPVAPDPIVEIPSAKDLKPGQDVPVLPLELGKSPAKWLASRVIPVWIASDPLKELGGAEHCRPERGLAIDFEGAKYEFAPLAPEFVPPAGGIYLNIAKSVRPPHVKSGPGPELAKDGPITMCVYAVLDNAEPRYVKVNAGFTRWGKQQFILNGHNLAHGQVVKLEKGLYPLLVIIRVKARWDSLAPKFDAASEADLPASQALLARLQQEYADAVKDWEADVADWKRSGGLDQEYQALHEIARYLLYLQFREGVGTGGAQSTTSAEAYELGLHPALYATAYRNCFLTDLSPFGDITQVVPRRVFTHVYPDKGAPFSQEIHGPTDTGADYFAYHFPIIKDEWKPAILWAWNRHLGVADAAGLAASQAGSKWYAPTRAFLNYPLDLEPKPPAGILPLTWEAPDFGYYGFRNGWKGRDDFLVQVYLRSNSPKGYAMPNAGTFRILGLGQEWVIGYPSVRLDNKRYFDPVVLLPEDATNDAGQGRTAFVKMEPDGSGVLTANLDDIYCKRVAYRRYGNLRIDSSFEDSGIRGLRAYGVDFSGKSGAPCLFVLVDKITDGKTKVWPWYLAGVKFNEQTGAVADTGEDVKSAKIEGNSVTVSKADGSTMRMTFAAPARPVIKAEARTLKFQQTYNRGEASFTAPGIFVSGADATDGNFLVVVTIQKGAPPAAQVTGEGMDAKITIGKRTVSFDGQKVVFGD